MIVMSSEPVGRLVGLPRPFPFVFAVVSVTALVATNQGEGIELTNLTLPITVALLAALVGWALGSLLAVCRTGQGLIALAFVLPVVLAGYLFGWTAGLFDLAIVPMVNVLLSTLIFGGTAIVVRMITVPERIGRFLNVMSLLLLIFTLPSIFRLGGREAISLPEPSIAVGPEIQRPDIYLVTLDAYSGTESLAAIYGFDNTAILDSLRARKFRIPSSPAANYSKTFLSVGSMLNREYMDDLASAAGPTFKDRRPAYRALEFNQTVADLKFLGYSFYYVGSSYPPMAGNRLADGEGAYTVSRNFESVWVSMTLLPHALFTWCRLRGCPKSEGLPFDAESAAETEERIDRFIAMGRQPGPKFVFMHLLLPHDPLRFGPDCEHRDDDSLADEVSAREAKTRRLYVEQVQCTNYKILSMVDRVREASGDSAVFLLQADHGYGRFAKGIPVGLDEARQDQIDERFDVFAAYAGPGGIADSLVAVRTPVNLFRTLFRVLWGANESPLPDRYFWTNPDRPMYLIEVDRDVEP